MIFRKNNTITQIIILCYILCGVCRCCLDCFRKPRSIPMPVSFLLVCVCFSLSVLWYKLTKFELIYQIHLYFCFTQYCPTFYSFVWARVLTYPYWRAVTMCKMWTKNRKEWFSNHLKPILHWKQYNINIC